MDVPINDQILPFVGGALVIAAVVTLVIAILFVAVMWTERRWGGKSKRISPALSDEGVRDLLNAGRKAEAVDLYARFAGVDHYTAQDAVDAIEQELISARKITTENE
jgi:hypothetical protein